MRITQNNFYNQFVTDQQNLKDQLDRLTQQMSSGKKIKYGYEDPQVFTDTLRLDYEESTLNQAVSVATDAQNFANNTDSVMFQFTDGLTRFKTLLIQAANGSNADSNYYAIGNELKSLKEHFVNLGNSSINGRYLFSGNKLDVKPLDDNGNYYGNGEELKAVVGAGVEVPYNIPGLDLFFGEDLNVNRTVTTNVALTTGKGEAATPGTTLEEITGNDDAYTFVINGRTGEGEIFSKSKTLEADATVEDLLAAVEDAYRNDRGESQVEVSLINGYIQVRDKSAGRSQLDFHIYGVDTQDDTKSLDFIKSEGVSAASYADEIPFAQTGEGSFRGNMPQIVLQDNSYANGTTKLSETTQSDLAGDTVTVNATDKEGTVHTFTYSLDSDFSPQTADEVSYRQLFDKIEESLNSETAFSDARVYFDRTGKINVEANGLSGLTMSDDATALLFNTNDALTVDDPKHDFFAAIDEAIAAVENGLTYPDGDNGALARNPGIENALARIDHVMAHVGKEHTKIGAMSNSLQYAVERNETLKLNVQTLRSDILDTDIGEASVKLNQLSLNYQALMASIAKVQNLSLVNYM